jgi:hypothetical protein
VELVPAAAAKKETRFWCTIGSDKGRDGGVHCGLENVCDALLHLGDV